MPDVQLVEEEDEAYMKRASGMGQTKRMSIVSSEEDRNEPVKEDSKLLIQP